MTTGVVKFYNRNKDFGFIHGEDGADYYFNAARLSPPAQGAKVTFNGYKNQQGDQAKSVAAFKQSGPSAKRIALVCAVVAVVSFAAGYLLGAV